MKFRFKLHAALDSRDRELELAALPAPRETSGRLAVKASGEPLQADWAEVSPRRYSILLAGRSYDVRIEKQTEGAAADGTAYSAQVGARVCRLELRDARRRRHSGSAGALEGPQEILAPMPGRIVKVLTSENEQVPQGGSLLVIEAMKMQNEIHAPRAGRVEKIYVAEGEGVESGARLLRLV